MKTDNLSQWMLEHVFEQGNPLVERGTRLVVRITPTLTTTPTPESLAVRAEAVHATIAIHRSPALSTQT